MVPEHTFFSGKLVKYGDSKYILVPATVCEYIGVKEGDMIRCKVVKAENGDKKK